ncbi:MAG: patatin-like phospholipase family protein [Clostridia bacterium]|nr:patatin-like phospholipase family protein [Clostridia bacterium]
MYKIGLALGAGAARGLSHIGVLQVFEENNIKVDCIAGSSIGALIGALYCSGVSAHMIEKIGMQLEQKKYMDFIVPRKGFIAGKKIVELIDILTQKAEFEDLKIPLSVMATDLNNSRSVVIREGSVSEAVRASIAIPGIFVPVEKGDSLLVDGGVADRVPVQAVRDMGADIVVAVDVGFAGAHKKATNILEVILQSIEVMELEIANTKIIESDYLIRPDVKNVNPANFNNVEECVKLGREASLEVVNELKARL